MSKVFLSFVALTISLPLVTPFSLDAIVDVLERESGLEWLGKVALKELPKLFDARHRLTVDEVKALLKTHTPQIYRKLVETEAEVNSIVDGVVNLQAKAFLRRAVAFGEQALLVGPPGVVSETTEMLDKLNESFKQLDEDAKKAIMDVSPQIEKLLFDVIPFVGRR